ncbi:hypothetical protein [Polyangium spumosum]|uniref:hypothetical protein n=1 Tax=Polyangium spumosum TaxID=889282 RepID=UPI003084377C
MFGRELGEVRVLFDFIAELRRNRGLREEFLADPEGVMSREGLTEEEKETIRARDFQRLTDAVARELGSVAAVDLRSWVPWFPPRPRITSISPRSGRAGEEVLVTIYGVFFPVDARAELRRGDVRVVGAVESVAIGRQARITARFTLGEQTPLGLYDVVVHDGEDASEARAGTLAGAFTVHE